MKTACLLIGAIVLVACLARADIIFAVPDDGRITLGVFDGRGRLVRTLHKLAPQENFRIGLNGLITNWDGKDDEGRDLPSGHYHVRGYLVGNDVRVSGEDFLFNDFAADEGFPGLSQILDFSLLENGDLLLLAASQLGAPFLARISEDRGFLWSVAAESVADPVPGGRFTSPRQTDSAGHPLGGSVIQLSAPAAPPHFPPMLAANSKDGIVISDKGFGIHSLHDGKQILSTPPGGGAAPLALAATESEILVSSEGGLTAIAFPQEKPAVTDLDPASKDSPGILPTRKFPNAGKVPLPRFSAKAARPEGETPAPAGEPRQDAQAPRETFTKTADSFTSLDADGSAILGASPEGVWIRQGGDFTAIPMPATVRSVALGTPGTFWFVGAEKEALFVGQSTLGGEILRTLRSAPDDPKPAKIRASRTAEKFAVLEALPGGQRLRVMARSEGGEWMIEWERTIRDSTRFGFVGGKACADAGSTSQVKTVRFRLKENPLTGQKDFLTVRAISDESGSRLVSPDGLPLVDVSTRSGVVRPVIQRGESPGALRLLQGNGTFVEEFSIVGLDDILPLDAGDIELP